MDYLHSTQGSEDVPERVVLARVAAHRRDGRHLHRAPLVGIQSHQQRHGVIHLGSVGTV